MIASVAVLTSTMYSKQAPLFAWNASESVPIGLYRVQVPTDLIVTSLVVACRRSCSRSSLPNCCRHHYHQSHPCTPRSDRMPQRTRHRGRWNRHGRGMRVPPSRSRTPRVAGLPTPRRGRGLSHELGRAGITRQPPLRSEPRFQLEVVASASKADPLFCAIRRLSWLVGTAQHHVRRRRQATIVKGVAPNFDMPHDAYFDSGYIEPGALTPDRDGALTAPVVSSDDRERGWSTALSPAKPPHADTTSADMPSRGRSAKASRSGSSCGCICDNAQSTGQQSFAPRSSERRP
jgi:hypothetical protein